MVLRHEKAADSAAIGALVYEAFTGHPQHAPGAEPTEHRIVEALRSSGALTLSLVAEEYGLLAGHIAFSEVLINGQRMEWYGVGPLAVHPARQRQGIGSALMRQGIAELRARGARGLVLVGDPGYYDRFGFSARDELILPGVPPQFFLVLPFETPMPAGTVSFHPAFT